MYSYESVVDIYGFMQFCSQHAGIPLSKSGLRKQINTVWSDPINSKKEMMDYYDYDLTPGMRIKVLSGVADYPLATAYQLSYMKSLIRENGSPEGAKLIIRQKRKEAAVDTARIEDMINGSDAFENLKIIHYRCYCEFKLCIKSFFELCHCILDVRDKVMVSEDDQRRLMELFRIVLACYQRDIERYKCDLIEQYEIDCADVFKIIEDKMTIITKHADEVRNAIPLDNRRIIEKVKESLFMRITRLDPNSEFPTLICLILKNESYYDITMTQDTRDGGCDIWAATKTDLGEHIHMISLKRYTTANISVAEVNDFIQDIKKYPGVKPHLIASTKFSSNAIRELEKNAIDSMDIDAIISILIRNKIGISKGYGLDEQFWYSLREYQVEFRRGPIEKYISRTTT